MEKPKVAVSATATGSSGRVRFGYQVAAELGAWTLMLDPRPPRSYRIKANVRQWNAHWRTHSPLTLVLDVGGSVWEWSGVVPAEETDSSVVYEVRGLPTIIRFAGAAAREERV